MLAGAILVLSGRHHRVHPRSLRQRGDGGAFPSVRKRYARTFGRAVAADWAVEPRGDDGGGPCAGLDRRLSAAVCHRANPSGRLAHGRTASIIAFARSTLDALTTVFSGTLVCCAVIPR